MAYVGLAAEIGLHSLLTQLTQRLASDPHSKKSERRAMLLIRDLMPMATPTTIHA